MKKNIAKILCLIILTQSSSVLAQVFSIDETGIVGQPSHKTILRRIYGDDLQSVKTKHMSGISMYFSSEKVHCNNTGCKTLLISKYGNADLYSLILSNGEFSISDSFSSSIGNGPLINFYRNNSCPLSLRILPNQHIIE